jgi:1,4-alpha-glucan branching enzyme
VSVDDREHSVLAFLRRDKAGNAVLCAFNFNPEPYEFRIRLPFGCELSEILSSDDVRFGGTGEFRNGNPAAKEDGPEFIVTLRMPPYAGSYYSCDIP